MSAIVREVLAQERLLIEDTRCHIVAELVLTDLPGNVSAAFEPMLANWRWRYIKLLKVAPRARRQGLAQLLLSNAIIRAQGIDGYGSRLVLYPCALDNSISDTRLRQFYAANGFQKYSIYMWRQC